jgi:hemerythrin superfamily protein
MQSISKAHSTDTTKNKTVEHDVITLLKIDHAEFKRMFSAYEKLAEKNDAIGKQKLANKIYIELIAHTLAEEEVFYPGAREATQDDAMLNEGVVEHDSFKEMVAQIVQMEPNDPMYDAKVKVLGEYLVHHVNEEDTEMFPAVREAKELDLRNLATAFTKRKHEIMKKLTNAKGKIDQKQLKALIGLPTHH